RGVREGGVAEREQDRRGVGRPRRLAGARTPRTVDVAQRGGVPATDRDRLREQERREIVPLLRGRTDGGEGIERSLGAAAVDEASGGHELEPWPVVAVHHARPRQERSEERRVGEGGWCGGGGSA